MGTGSIAGVVTDAQEKALGGAKVEITDKARAAVIHLTTSSAGIYSSGPIQPGEYVVRIEVTGFNPAALRVAVQIGNTTAGNVKMLVGPVKPGVEIAGGTAVNIQQATVQSVVSGDRVEKLPIGGRNFIDLAQLEPGVQMQDGGVLGPSKNGISSISFLNRYGRGVRTEVDGVDVTDEVVGTTTQNIGASAIEEFQLPQALLDLSMGLTSAGALNVITRSGSDQIHGALFGVYRGDQGAAALPKLHGRFFVFFSAGAIWRECGGSDRQGQSVLVRRRRAYTAESDGGRAV